MSIPQIWDARSSRISNPPVYEYGPCRGKHWKNPKWSIECINPQNIYCVLHCTIYIYIWSILNMGWLISGSWNPSTNTAYADESWFSMFCVRKDGEKSPLPKFFWEHFVCKLRLQSEWEMWKSPLSHHPHFRLERFSNQAGDQEPDPSQLVGTNMGPHIRLVHNPQ